MEWYVNVLKKYAVFEGRARRKEYWMFILFNMIISAILGLIDQFIIKSSILTLVFIYGLAVFLPSLGVAIRRLHDTGRRGWWYLIGLVPVIGQIWLFVLFCLPGEDGSNQYGEDPKLEVK